MFKCCSKSFLPVFALLLLFAVWRLWELFDFSLDWDETNTLAQAQLPILEMLPVNLHRDISLPGMPFLMHWWVLLAGGSDQSVRLLAWLLGLVAILASYGLSLQLSASQKTAWITALLVGVSPFAMHYASVATKHGAFMALVLSSWWLLLRAVSSTSNNFVLGLYVLVTLMALHLEPIGPVFFIFQGLYLFWMYRQQPAVKPLGWVWAGIGLTYLPEAYLLLQPWHPIHLNEIHNGYSIADPLMLLWTFPNLLLSGVDGWPPNLPAGSIALVMGLGGWGLYAGWRLLNQAGDRQERAQLLCIGGLPILTLGLLCWVFQSGACQFRAILFGVFFSAYLFARWISSDTHTNANYTQANATGYLRWWLLLLVVLIQLGFGWQQSQGRQEDPYREVAGLLKQYGQPDDGVVIIPGFHYLPLVRYWHPQAFGISAKERRLDPAQHDPVEHDIYNMINIDQPHLLGLTGSALQSSVGLERFLKFQRAHRRIWFPGNLEFQPYLTCGKIYFGLERRDGKIIVIEHRCLRDLQPNNPAIPPRLFCHHQLNDPSWRCGGG